MAERERGLLSTDGPLIWLLLGVLPVAVLLLVAWTRRPRWPFQHLQRRGRFQSSPLPSGGSSLEERKRDFARTKPGLLVVTPSASDPSTWSSKALGGDLNKEVLDEVFQELKVWLNDQLKQLKCTCQLQLAERVVALVAATEGFRFAMEHKVPPLFPQSKFVLVLGSDGQVLSEDLNSEKAAQEAEKRGVALEYVTVSTQATDLEEYLKKDQAAALSRGAVEDCWDDVLGFL